MDDDVFYFLRYEDVSPQSVFRALTWQACGAAHHLASPWQAAGTSDAWRERACHLARHDFRGPGGREAALAPCLNCYSLSARAPCFNGRVEPQHPIVRTVVQLPPTLFGVLLFAWVGQCASTL